MVNAVSSETTKAGTAGITAVRRAPDEKVNFIKSIPFISVHLASLLVFWVGFSWTALAMCLAMYLVRMFGITAGYHRYFSHRSYKTTRVFQLFLALLGASSAQMGPLWWAAHHRHHHRYSDTEQDLHTPGLKGFFWAHMGWIMCVRNNYTNFKNVRDWVQFPELRIINKLHMLVPAVLAVKLYYLGVFCDLYIPALDVSGMQMLVWGFFVSTVLLYHMTFTINSLAHQIGFRRFDTGDDSRNNPVLALVTLGEGWHNNHHKYPHSERQGFYWYEVDITHYGLKALSWLGLVWDMKTPPKEVYERK